MTDNTSTDGWHIYRSKRGKKKNRIVDSSCELIPEEHNESTVISSSQRDQLKRRIESHIGDLDECIKNIVECFTDLRPSCGFHSIVCYGIGSPVHSYESRCQLALLVGLSRKLAEEGTCCDFKCFIYDPILSSDEYDLLKNCFDLHAITKNEECRRAADETTLFFMPHLDAHYYNNLLEANWQTDRIMNVHILGNSLKYIIDSVTRAEAESKFQFIKRASSSSLWREFSVSEYHVTKYESSFNQLTLQGLAEATSDEHATALTAMLHLTS